MIARSYIIRAMEMPAPQSPHAAIMTVTPLQGHDQMMHAQPPKEPKKKWTVSGEIPATAVMGGVIAMAVATVGNIWLGGRYVERLETRILTIEKQMEENRQWREKNDTIKGEMRETMAVVRTEMQQISKETDRTRTTMEAILNRLPK